MKSNWIACTLLLASSVLLPGSALAQVDASGAPADYAISKQASGLSSAKQTALNDAQLAEANARLELAKALVDRVESDAKANRLGEGWQGDAMRTLLPLHSQQLKALAADRGTLTYSGLVGAARFALANPEALPQTKLLGDLTQDLVFNPITPCRNVDTRNAGGPIAGGTFRDFNADSGAAQGGTAGCFVVPATDASAWALNITVVNMNTTGFVAVRSVGSTALTSLVNYTAPGQQVNNFVIVNNSRASGNEYEVFAASTVDVIVDLFGYFLPPNKTALDCTDVRTDTTAATGGGFDFTTSSCAAGYTLTGGGCLGSTSFTFANLVYSGPQGSNSTTTWLCTWVNNGASAQSVAIVATCCRTPGR